MHSVSFASLTRFLRAGTGPCRPFALFAALCLGALPLAAAGGASPSALVEGRVLDAASGNYLRDAKISIGGTNHFVLTDDYGHYQVTVPGGASIRLQVSYSGMVTAEAVVTPAAGSVVNQDFPLELAGGQTVKLGAFVVAARRDAAGQAIAIDAQRYSPNVVNAVSADQFGDVTEGNVGEFMKNLPGVLVDYNAADARTISVRGLPPSMTAVEVDGDPLASASSGGTTRQFELEQVSLNNASRIEVTKSPTPDEPANTLGGMVNLVSKSAFERSASEFDYRAYLTGNSTQLTLNKVPIGPDGAGEMLVRPGFDFTYVDPISKNFGIVITALTSNEYNPQTLSQTQWLPIAGSLPGGTPSALSASNPYLGSYRLQNSPTTTTRDSMGATVDWRFTPDDTVSLGFTDSYYNAYYYIENYTFSVGSATAATSTSTTGKTGSGDAYTSTGWRRKSGITWSPHVHYRHDGPVWTVDASGYYSEASNRYRDIDDGFMNTVAAGLTGATVNFSGITANAPSNITLLNSSGVAVNPFDPTAWALTATSSYTNNSGYTGPFYSNQSDALDTVRGGHLNASRDFNFGIPVTIKMGADYRDEVRDIRVNNPVWKYIGPAGMTSSLMDTSMSTVPAPYGFGQVGWLDAAKAYRFFEANPADFSQVLTGNFGTIANDVNGSKYINESVSSGYVRMDTRLLDERLWLVGGMRFEGTRDIAYGPLNDSNAMYRHAADGSLVLGSNGKPVLITTDATQQALLRYQDRGDGVRRYYGGYYPDLIANYTLGQNLVARASYAKTIGRPDFNFIVPGTTITDPTSASQLITVNNPALQPWTADNYDLSLEYYFHPAGVVSVGVFRKDISNFFGNQTAVATPALLEQYGLDPDLYSGYNISTLTNVGNARVTGMEFNYSQQLTFLPEWAKGLSVYGNGTLLHLEGPGTADFSAFVPKTWNWGVSLDRPRFSVMLKWTYRSDERLALRTGTGVPSGDYQYLEGTLKLDLNAEYRIRKGLSLFINGRNLTNQAYILEYYSLGTPGYARQYNTQSFGVQYSAGLKGSF